MRRRDRLEPPVVANAIQRRREVGCRVGERAVEIEQHGVDGQRARGPREGAARQPSGGRRNAIM